MSTKKPAELDIENITELELHDLADSLRHEGKPAEVTGERAIQLLAWFFADETHGNYDWNILHRRAALEKFIEVTIKAKPRC
jgi:hypothetical protein